MCSEEVDPEAQLTKAALKEFDEFNVLLSHLFFEDYVTLAYALGAVQNTCGEPEYLDQRQKADFVIRLQNLPGSDDTLVANFSRAPSAK